MRLKWARYIDSGPLLCAVTRFDAELSDTVCGERHHHIDILEIDVAPPSAVRCPVCSELLAKTRLEWWALQGEAAR